MTDQEALIVLNAIDGLGNIRIKKLVDYFGSPSRIFSLKDKELLEAQIVPASVVYNIRNFSRDQYLREEMDLCRQENVCVVSIVDDNYPESLNQIVDAPVVLYVKGKFDFNESMMIDAAFSIDGL